MALTQLDNNNKNVRFFNFPIQLLEDFLDDPVDKLEKIAMYSIYTYSKDLEHREGLEGFKLGCQYFDVTYNDYEKAYTFGMNLYDLYNLDHNSYRKSYKEKGNPMVGINKDTWWQFKEDRKTDFEKVTLLAYLGIKSILQDKAYCKISNNFWLSRMFGSAKVLPDYLLKLGELGKYNNHYQFRKLKSELERSWGFVTFTGRGTNWSDTMSIDDLTFQILKRRKGQKDYDIKRKKKEAIEKALIKLNRL